MQLLELVFPACVGMSRSGRPNPLRRVRCPCVSGDEPYNGSIMKKDSDVFPACVGMSPN